MAFSTNQLERRSCKDDLGRVFALRGLNRDETNLDIQPAYMKTFEQVYTDLTRDQLRLGNLEVLYYAVI